MLITKLGEFGLIENFKKSIRLDPSVIKGTGDDCAVIKFTKDKYLLFTCDMITEGVDFNSRERPYLIGRKAIAVCLSDIAACAGIPRYCVVSLGMPKKTSVGFVDKLFEGILNTAKKFKLNLVGGDLSETNRLTIDVSMLGVVEKKNVVFRCGAKIGDIIFVTGTLGGSILGRHLKFVPRLKEARFLVKNFRVNSVIDISDGLAQDLSHILKESKCGAIIYEDLIPLSPQARNLRDALYGGEDFELLFTLPHSEAKKLSAKQIPGFKAIGEITAAKYGLRLIDKFGKERTLKPKGFKHF